MKRLVQAAGRSNFAVEGGAEPSPIIGHLSSGEPIVKPTQKGRFFILPKKGVIAEEE